MSTPKVYNWHHKDAPSNAIYIGRGSPWGNPFSHGNYKNTIHVENREEAISRFEQMVDEDPTFRLKIQEKLQGKDLVCYCAPLPCHGDVLLRVANQ